MEDDRQKKSEVLAKTLEMLEEWKKLWKKKIIQSYKKYFLSFFTKYWKKRGKKNSEDLAKTLEMLEEWKKLWKKKIIRS